jgi:hypothetical protein
VTTQGVGCARQTCVLMPLLQVPVATLAKALPMLLDVLVLCLFAFFVFGVVAVQLFAGALRSRCVGTCDSCQPSTAGCWQHPADMYDALCCGPVLLQVCCGGPQQRAVTPGSSWRAANICKRQLPVAG